MHEQHKGHNLVRTSPFYTSPFWRTPEYGNSETGRIRFRRARVLSCVCPSKLSELFAELSNFWRKTSVSSLFRGSALATVFRPFPSNHPGAVKGFRANLRFEPAKCEPSGASQKSGVAPAKQTRPKKGQFMNFSQGHSGTNIQCESCLFS